MKKFCEYQKPRLVLFNFQSAIGNCAAFGDSNVDGCLTGGVAAAQCTNTGQNTTDGGCEDGVIAVKGCNPGTTVSCGPGGSN